MGKQIENLSKIQDNSSFFKSEIISKRTTSDWKELFSAELSSVFSTKIYSIDFKFLYRARLNSNSTNNPIDFFLHTKNLWAPPRKKVAKQGRCNSINQSLLYCSTHPTTTIFELKPPSGTELTIMEYRSLGELNPLNLIGVEKVSLSGKNLEMIFNSHFENSKKKSIEIDKILSEIFSNLNDNNPDFPIYNLTNAITQIFLNNQKFKPVDRINVAPKSIGLIYPSVETSKPLGINIVFNPKSVYLSLIPNICYKYKIVKRVDEHHYHIMLTHETSKIYPNGEMKWRLIIDPKMEYITDLELGK